MVISINLLLKHYSLKNISLTNTEGYFIRMELNKINKQTKHSNFG